MAWKAVILWIQANTLPTLKKNDYLVKKINFPVNLKP